ncbi:hypothetical protein [Gluconobacter japonicus]|uniref:hypothetical protein n=1 Tax=Gluconobacter japonicus TaxID=376620 RepID=UPI000A94F1CB|nr:hypothetical protein [Gluconobacter japonicus]
MQISQQTLQDIKDVAGLAGGVFGFLALVFAFTCLPSFLAGPVPPHYLASATHSAHSRG